MSPDSAHPPTVHALGRLLVVGAGANVPRDALECMADRHGWNIEAAVGIDDTIDSCNERWPEVAVVDASGMARRDFEPVLKWLRRQARVAVVLITAADDVEARLQALQIGVDDHAVAPVDPRELEARIEAQLRRVSRQNMRILGDLAVDRQARRVVRRGQTVTLTPNELALFERLLVAAGQVVSKRELQDAIGRGAQSENAIEVHISALRRKLGRAGPPLIHTVHAQGYVLRPQPSYDLSQRAELLERREALIQKREEAVAERDRILAAMEAQWQRRLPPPPRATDG
jgi:two-component system response regulator QseB